MSLKRRLDRLAAQARPVPVAVSPEDGIAKICVVLERYAPSHPGEVFADTYERLHVVLDRLAAIGWAIPDRAGHSLADRIAAALGMTTMEWRAALQARARGEQWCG